VRLDKLLVERGLESSRERAATRIEAGEVLVSGMVVTRPASMVDPGADVALSGAAMRFVSRGGLKLEQALEAFGIDCTGRVVIDVGASTGGFTDCVLQRGASRVFAVDVGYGQLAWKLRTDARVVVLERANIRSLDPAAIEQKSTLAVIDCSFIGLTKVLPATLRFVAPGADIVALVKPQFEVGPGHVGKGGVVRDVEARRAAIDAVREDAARIGLEVRGGVDCDTHGPNGNVEYLLWLRVPLSGPASPSA
jgi:23S rRNA (cytidine1920-2'-O)/16S rRNA (cytidine1409-2'-O)-methyltransferase